MIEEIMIFALGFLVAGLLSLFVLPLFWRRALRLTRRRLEMQMPLSMSEVFADRDRLRAQYAVERCRLENSIEDLAEKHAQALVRTGRAEAAAAALREKLAITEEALAAAECSIREFEVQVAALSVEIHDSSSLFQAKSEALALLERRHRDLGQLADERRAVNAALETRISALEMRLADSLREAAAAKSAASQGGDRAKALSEQGAILQRRAVSLERENSELERRLADAVGRLEQTSATLDRTLADLADANQEKARLSGRASQAEERATMLRASLERHSQARRSEEHDLAERLEFSEAKVVELKAALEEARTNGADLRPTTPRRRSSSRSLKGLEVVSSQPSTEDRPEQPGSHPDDSLLNRPA